MAVISGSTGLERFIAYYNIDGNVPIQEADIICLAVDSENVRSL